MLDWPGPGLSVIGAVGDKHPIAVAAKGQPNGAGFAIHHRAGITDGDLGRTALLVDKLHRPPGLAAVGAAAEHQVVIAIVGGTSLAALAKGQQCVFVGQDDGWDPVGVVTLGPADEYVHLLKVLLRPGNVAANGRGSEEHREDGNAAGVGATLDSHGTFS